MRVLALALLFSAFCLPPLTLFAQRLSITPAPVTIVAGKSEDIMVVLSSQPTGDVTVTIATRSGADIRLDRSELIFTPSNWNQPQKVTIMADQNADLSDDDRALILIASGGGYVGSGVTVSPYIALIQSPGETLQLNAVFRDQNNDSVTGVTLEWSSEDSTIAVVDSTGKITAVSPGITTVVAAFATAEGTATTWVGYPSEFKTFTGLRIENDGSITLQTGNITLSAGVADCLTGGDTFNGNRFDYHWTAWQGDAGSGWAEVPGTKRTDNNLCGYDLASAAPGTYRLVGDMTLAGVRDNYKSENEVGGGNRPPAAVGTISARWVNVGDDVSVDDISSYFSDPDGDALTYTATSSDPNLATVSVSGVTVTVTGVAEGTATITVTATDPGGFSATQSFDVTIQGNRSPVAVGSISARWVNVGDDVSVDDVSSYFSDPDGDALAYTAISSDPSLATVSVSGSTITVTGVAEGSLTITVTATDPGGLEASHSFEVMVTVPNRAPTAIGTISDISVNVGETSTVDVASNFTDPDGDNLSFAASSSSTAATVTISGSVVTVSAVAAGSATITVTATDPSGLEASHSFEVTVPNRAPTTIGTISDISVTAGETSTVDVASNFMDPDGDNLSFAASSSSTAATVTISGSAVTVSAVAAGSAMITVTAIDPGSLEASLSFEVTVPNRAPTAIGTISDISVTRGETSTVDLASNFTDPDGDALTYTATSSDPSLSTVSVSGSTVTVTGVAEGSATITVTATDPSGLEASHSFEVKVTVPNRAPTAIGTISDISVTAGETFTVDVASNFTDPDGDNLSFAASSSAAAATVTISGSAVTVSAVAAGSATITVTATDPGGLEASHSFEVTVTELGFNIELYFTHRVSASARAIIETASSHWESILAGTELDDRTYDRPLTCLGVTLTPDPTKTIDDLLILVDSRPNDGQRGTAAFASPCWVRGTTYGPTNFTIYGAMVFDSDDINTLPETTGLYDVALHEIAHVLGIGILWDVTNPSSGIGAGMDADTHFPGAEAVSAFNSAGGSGYSNGKVPVENGGDNSHWRHSVFPDELMAPSIFVDHPSPLSAITIQALADLGYTVDASLADAYTVSVSPDPPLGEVVEDLGPVIYLGNDVPRTPITVVDEYDRVVRVILPR